MKVAVVGASGFTGTELIRWIARHPLLELVAVQANSWREGLPADVDPLLLEAVGEAAVGPVDPASLNGADAVLSALPHKVAHTVIKELATKVGWVVDLSADFRFKDASLYERVYGQRHGAQDLLPDFVVGIPEIHREEIKEARYIAVPGCYVTAAVLGLWPLVSAGLASGTLIVNAASGVSGAGSSPSEATHFCSVYGDFKAYGLPRHRHQPEMEMLLGTRVAFVPHLLPASRGILVTAYAQGTGKGVDPRAVLEGFYAGRPLVRVIDRPPRLAEVTGTPMCTLWATELPDTGLLVVFSALDNLAKGAATQAIQCLNIAAGFPEQEGLLPC